MKIRTQLLITLFVFGIALCLIGVFVAVTDQNIDRLTKQGDLADGIQIGADELSYLSSDYVLYRENQQAARWLAKFAELESNLSGISVDTAEQQVQVNNIKADAKRL